MPAATPEAQVGQAPPGAVAGVGGPYAWYVTTIIVLANISNFVDRQILSILAEDIKAGLGITDAEIGFLYGTVFAVFFALFGISLGRLADMWNRTRLLSAAVALWSGMAMLSGLAQNVGQFAVARIGVGVGQSGANPPASSLLCDLFPREKRATALSIYTSGAYIGGGLSLLLGGLIVSRWDAAFPQGGPLGLAGWQATLLITAFPGLLLALLLAFTREPMRGISEGIVTPPTPNPFKRTFAEFACMLPPFTLFHVARHGRRALGRNLLALVIATAFVVVMTAVTGNWLQWLAMAFAGYAVYSWSQTLAVRDAPTHALTWKTPLFLILVFGLGLLLMIYYGLGFWAAPYAIRVLGADKAVVGLALGVISAGGGFLSVLAGGFLADWFHRRNPGGRIIVILTSIIVPMPLAILQYSTVSEVMFYVWALLFTLAGSLWGGSAFATIQDLVLPRMRGTAVAVYGLAAMVIGLGFGPFLGGLLSEMLGDLRQALIALSLLLPLPMLCMLYAYRHLPAVESSRVERARAAGEDI